MSPIAAAASPLAESEVGQAVRGKIDKFFEGMPAFMNALDAVADLHPFIGGKLILRCA